ncbi:MAG: hypothetical protein RI947_1109 [Candidatus Parcubacteria bacterium]|jgi:hypothetical protein
MKNTRYREHFYAQGNIHNKIIFAVLHMFVYCPFFYGARTILFNE